MLSKKLKDSEEGEEGASSGMGEGGKDSKVKEKKKATVDSGLVIVEVLGVTTPYRVAIFARC